MLWTVGHTISFFVSFHPKRQKQFVQDPFEQIGGSFAAVDGKFKKEKTSFFGDPTKRIFD